MERPQKKGTNKKKTFEGRSEAKTSTKPGEKLWFLMEQKKSLE